jgi:serralysin
MFHRHKRHLLPLLVPACAAFALAAVPAHAAPSMPEARSTAAAGLVYFGTDAANHVSVRLSGGSFLIDDSSPIKPGAGCEAVAGDATKVKCVAFKVGLKLRRFEADLGGGDDILANDTSIGGGGGAPMIGFGDAGDDRIFGAGGNVKDELRGGSGDDKLLGRGGASDDLDGGADDDQLFGGDLNDNLRGGSGDDVLDGSGSDDLLDGGPGADVIDGGTAGVTFNERHDRVDYGSRVKPVRVDLRRSDASQGEDGERDTIRDVEAVSGGDGDDTLLGNAFDNALDGRGGNDGIQGFAGLDVLTGGDGDDALVPSPNSGVNVLSDGVRDIMDCGFPGRSDGDPGDVAFRVLADDDFVTDCATVIDQ